jgi:hypothetical protein
VLDETSLEQALSGIAMRSWRREPTCRRSASKGRPTPGGVAARRPALTSWQWRAGNTIVSLLARAGVGPIQLLTTGDRSYGRTTHDYLLREVGADEAGPVLKRYVAVATKTRTQFDATRDSPVEDFAAEADRHPVFELVATAADTPTDGTSTPDC